MKYLKIIFILLFYFNISSHSYSGEIYFINVKKILNESKAGKKYIGLNLEPDYKTMKAIEEADANDSSPSSSTPKKQEEEFPF